MTCLLLPETTESHQITAVCVGAGKVEAIFRVCREGESERLLHCGVDTNHRLLFHGSSSSNLISILSRGLLIAPPEAPASGYLFGKVASCLSVADPWHFLAELPTNEIRFAVYALVIDGFLVKLF